MTIPIDVMSTFSETVAGGSTIGHRQLNE